LLLGLSLSLFQSSLSNINVKSLVNVQGNSAVDTDQRLDSPVHKGVSPIWSVGSSSLGTPLSSNASKGALDERFWVWNQSGRPPDFGHGGGDEVRKDELGLDIVGSQFRSECGRPLLKESLGTRVGSEKWGW